MTELSGPYNFCLGLGFPMPGALGDGSIINDDAPLTHAVSERQFRALTHYVRTLLELRQGATATTPSLSWLEGFENGTETPFVLPKGASETCDPAASSKRLNSSPENGAGRAGSYRDRKAIRSAVFPALLRGSEKARRRAQGYSRSLIQLHWAFLFSMVVVIVVMVINAGRPRTRLTRNRIMAASVPQREHRGAA
ncbi:hypothetical protein [Novacetimonas sp. GS1]|uniref:hypothetical protein n=1 Tax=Novacetimonas sp. GS1 TaxID=3119990 RepID=UPI002FCD5F00